MSILNKKKNTAKKLALKIKVNDACKNATQSKLRVCNECKNRMLYIVKKYRFNILYRVSQIKATGRFDITY